MEEQKFDKGGFLPSGAVPYLIISPADRDKSLPKGWNPLHVIGPDECIISPKDMRCTRPDHSHD